MWRDAPRVRRQAMIRVLIADDHGASDRMQAALWAERHGLGPDDGAARRRST